MPDLFAALNAPFHPEEVKVRTQGGRQLHYVTARTVMNRLDNVLGPENWWDEYHPHENSVLCRISVKLPTGAVITKADAGGYAGMSDSGDDDKSGYSDAFKRAAVKFGIGRYLYRDGVPNFTSAAAPPEPAPAREPARDRAPAPAANGHQDRRGEAPPAGANGNGHSGPPRSGKALFAWTKDQEQRYEVGLLKYLNNWAKLQEFPGRMVEWDAEQVALGYAEACRKLQTIELSHGEAYEEALGN